MPSDDRGESGCRRREGVDMVCQKVCEKECSYEFEDVLIG